MLNTPSITLRLFEEADAGDLSQLILDNLLLVNIRDYGEAAVRQLANSYSPPLLKKYAGTGQVYVAVERSVLVGTIVLEQDHVRAVFVRVDRHRHGIGAMMMRNIEEVARTQGQRRLFLLSATSAAPFYEKLGYASVEEKDVPVGDERIRMVAMEKRLQAAC